MYKGDSGRGRARAKLRCGLDRAVAVAGAHGSIEARLPPRCVGAPCPSQNCAKRGIRRGAVSWICGKPCGNRPAVSCQQLVLHHGVVAMPQIPTCLVWHVMHTQTHHQFLPELKANLLGSLCCLLCLHRPRPPPRISKSCFAAPPTLLITLPLPTWLCT